jgi:ABC-2 type transport system permease protein
MSDLGVLLRRECRRALRSPVVWAVLSLLLVAGTWGALNTARLHTDQIADVAKMTRHEMEWYADIRVRAARYSQASSENLPYWQDPTGASGFRRYFLKRFAAKPHLPLSVLAVGQSDLQPFAVPLRLETLFGGDRVYDFEPPRALATGPFDLSLVLVFVIPLCIGAAVATIGAAERDQGILALIASQPITPRRWWCARLGALATILVPGVVLCVVIALAVAGAPIRTASPEIAAAAALVGAHALFWVATAGWCLARGHGAVTTASTVAGIWLVLTIAVPLAASMIVHSAVSRPSPVTDVNELRRTTGDVQREADLIVAKRLVAHFGGQLQSVDPPRLDYSTRLVLITEEMEQRLAVQEQRRQDYARAAGQIANVAGWLSPQLAFHTALADLAGTGSGRHHAFLRAVRAFQLELRAFMYPRVLEQVRSPTPRSCGACPGRLNFTDYDAIPRFTMQDAPSSARVVAALGTAAC